MLIRKSISDYKHIDFGNIKIAFTQICKDELFKDVYFAANSLYFVESGSAVLHIQNEKITVKQGEIVLIKQHSKLNIEKFKDEAGNDFKSIIFYLFPDFVTEFLKQSKSIKRQLNILTLNIIHLGKHIHLQTFCESLLPLFDKQKMENNSIKEKTFEALHHLSNQHATFIAFLLENSKPIKIDLYEFMIHIAVHNYSVIELATLTGRSLSGFKRDFSSVFETTPHQWLLDRKIEYAEKLMKEQNMKPTDIYGMLGFQELSHFSAAFKKKRGVAPTQL